MRFAALSVAALALILVGCTQQAASTQSSSQTSDQSSTAPVATTATTNGSETISGSFTDLIGQGKNLQCTWSGNQNGLTLNGMVYVSGNKFASIANGSVSGMNMTINIVGDGTTMYMWNNLAPTGTKMSYAQMQAASSPSASSMQAFSQFKQNYNYQCTPWQPDQSKFTVPSNITFTAT